jgi:hypothetical protein
LAQGGSIGMTPDPGAAAISFGSGYYAGQAAVGLGLTSLAKTSDRSFSAGVGISPGTSDIGASAIMRWKIGRGTTNLHASSSSAIEQKNAHLEYEVRELQTDNTTLRSALSALNLKQDELAASNASIQQMLASLQSKLASSTEVDK